MKKFLIKKVLIFTIAMTASVSLCVSATEGFETSESVVRKYLNALIDQDIEGVRECFAINEWAKNNDYIKKAKDGKSILPNFLLPSNNDIYIEMNRIQIESNMIEGMKTFYWYLCLGEEKAKNYLDLTMGPLEDMEYTALEFQDAINPNNIGSVVVVSIDQSASDIRNENLEKTFSTWATWYGADQVDDYVALILADGEYWVVGFMTALYDSNWKILGQYSNLNGINKELIHINSKEEYKDYT